ncbi:MAG: hypothetical protein H0U85_10155, partial [Gemmatimonadales bacterium]|nr:hypothetical protein [Gemmatimonadales bacterium]
MAGNIVPSDFTRLPAADEPHSMAPLDDRAMAMAEPDGAGGAQFGRYIAAVKRYKWIVVALTVLGTI